MSELEGILTLTKKKVKKEGIFGVLSKVRSQRSEKDLVVIENAIKNVDFIKGITKKLNPTLIKDLLSRLNYRCANKGDYLFKKGDKEDCFYIVLSGSIGLEKVNKRDKGISKVLGVGKSFGDLSFALFTEKRKYSAVALEESHLASLDKESFISTIGTLRMDIINLAQGLTFNSLFKSDWSKYDLMRIAVNFEAHEFKRDWVIYKEGDIAEEIFFLKSGEVESSVKLPDPERELHEIIQKDYDPGSPGKIKKVHLSLWNDYSIFGHEEFFEREIWKQDNNIKDKDSSHVLKRQTTTTVNSNKAEVWSINAQVFLDFIREKEAKFEDLRNLMNLKITRREDILRKSNDLSHRRYGSVPPKRSSNGNLKETSPQDEAEPMKFKGSNFVSRASLPLLEIEFEKQISQPRLPSVRRRVNSTSPDHEDQMSPVASTTLNLSSVMQFNFLGVQNKIMKFKKTIKENIKKEPTNEKGIPKPLFTKADQLVSFHNLLSTFYPHKNLYIPTTNTLKPNSNSQNVTQFSMGKSFRTPKMATTTKFSERGNSTYIPPIHTKDKTTDFTEVEFTQTPQSKYFGIRGFNADKLNTTSEFDKDIMHTSAPEFPLTQELKMAYSGSGLQEISENIKIEKPKEEKAYQSNFSLYLMNKSMRRNRHNQNMPPLKPREPPKKKISPLSMLISTRRNLEDLKNKNTQTDMRTDMRPNMVNYNSFAN